jgi:hypothetical protein
MLLWGHAAFPQPSLGRPFMGNYLIYGIGDTLSADNTLYLGFKYDLLIVIIFSDGTGLDDYPDSPGPAHAISSDDANSILDSEEPPHIQRIVLTCRYINKRKGLRKIQYQ